MAESKLRDLSTDFAVKVIKTCDAVKGHYSLVNQLERSPASIGANIYEANYAHGNTDSGGGGGWVSPALSLPCFQLSFLCKHTDKS